MLRQHVVSLAFAFRLLGVGVLAVESGCEGGVLAVESGCEDVTFRDASDDETSLLALRGVPVRPPRIFVYSQTSQLQSCLASLLDPEVTVQYPDGNWSVFDDWALHNHRVASEMKPLAVVFARGARDVVAATQCAVQAQLSVFGQSGRHSYLAYCREGCVLINTALIKTVKIDKSDQTAVLGAGLNLGQAYTWLDDAGFTIPGGTCPTVGLAGLTLGGGKGILIRQHGLLIDSLIGVEAVLRNGTFVHADAESFSDLLWLAKGGGGNVFPGVVVNFNFKLTPSPAQITEWTASWLVYSPGRDRCDAWPDCFTKGRAVFNVWQNNYVTHPDRRVVVRLELHPYKEGKTPPHILMSFKFIGMTREEAEPFTYPALRELGEPFGGGQWDTHAYIESLQRGGGIGMMSNNGTCKEWPMTPEEARAQMTMALPSTCSWEDRQADPTCASVPRDKWTSQVPTFCSYDGGFDVDMKYRALVMQPLSDTAIERFLMTVAMAPQFDTNHQSWQFYLQIDPTSGATGEVADDATAYPWRSREDMTLQVIAKWPQGEPLNPTLEGFNYLIVSVLQPYVGTRSYYNYADDDMPGGAIPLFSYFGPNAQRVVEVQRRYADLRIKGGMEWELLPFRVNQSYGVSPWIEGANIKHASTSPAVNLFAAEMLEANRDGYQ